MQLALRWFAVRLLLSLQIFVIRVWLLLAVVVRCPSLLLLLLSLRRGGMAWQLAGARPYRGREGTRAPLSDWTVLTRNNRPLVLMCWVCFLFSLFSLYLLFLMPLMLAVLLLGVDVCKYFRGPCLRLSRQAFQIESYT